MALQIPRIGVSAPRAPSTVSFVLALIATGAFTCSPLGHVHAASLTASLTASQLHGNSDHLTALVVLEPNRDARPSGAAPHPGNGNHSPPYQPAVAATELPLQMQQAAQHYTPSVSHVIGEHEHEHGQVHPASYKVVLAAAALRSQHTTHGGATRSALFAGFASVAVVLVAVLFVFLGTRCSKEDDESDNASKPHILKTTTGLMLNYPTYNGFMLS